MSVFSVGDYAARATRLAGVYVGTSRVAAIVRRLIAEGAIPEHRAGRVHVITESELPVLDAQLGITREAEKEAKEEAATA